MKQSVLWIGIVAVLVLIGGFYLLNSGQDQNTEDTQTMTQSETQDTMESDGETQMPEMNIVETAESTGTFTTLLAAAEAAGLTQTLAEGGPYTVFAPTDEAFEKLPEGTVESLLQETSAYPVHPGCSPWPVQNPVHQQCARDSGKRKDKTPVFPSCRSGRWAGIL